MADVRRSFSLIVWSRGKPQRLFGFVVHVLVFHVILSLTPLFRFQTLNILLSLDDSGLKESEMIPDSLGGIEEKKRGPKDSWLMKVIV